MFLTAFHRKNKHPILFNVLTEPAQIINWCENIIWEHVVVAAVWRFNITNCLLKTANLII